MKTTIVAAVAALAAGTWIGYEVAPRGAKPAAAADDAEYPRAAIADVGANASVEALRRRVKELEAELARAKASAPGDSAETVIADLGIPVEKGEDGKYKFRRPSREEMRERMRAEREKWRAEHPEEAARMDAEFKKMRERHAARTQSKLDFLGSVDTSRMSAADKATHDEMQALIAKREELRAKMHAEGLSDDEREQVMGDLFETERALREKGGEERAILFRQAAEALGFTGDDAEEIVTTLDEIISATEQGGRGRGRGPGGPGGFGGPGMPPPAGGPAPGGATPPAQGGAAR